MKYISTRGDRTEQVTFSKALEKGLAKDGGLFVPEQMPSIRLQDFSREMSLADFATKLLEPFLAGDRLEKDLVDICQAALNFPIPLRYRDGVDGNKTAVIELFHGPTAAFKDVGARFLAECVSRTPSAKKRTVIVATSGDTGGAVAGAFAHHPDIEVYVLFPKGLISARQEKQIACWGPSVKAFAVRGTFDDCQRIVKEALSSSEWRAKKTFISANSISIGRLLPQMTYYAKASLDYQRARRRKTGFIIPTGNLGHGAAALWAKSLGFPIEHVVLATNANHVIKDFFASGVWQPHASIATLANAMDVGNPSNIERVRALYPDLADLKKDVSSESVSDSEISDQLLESFKATGEIICPHTATAFVALKKFADRDWTLVATAHPAKFETIVEPLIGQTVEVPPALAALLNRTSKVTEIEARLDALT